ncbi:hypothetical protein [Paenibacillus vandeheii]
MWREIHGSQFDSARGSFSRPYTPPEQKNGISTKIPGIYFVGLSGERSFASANLRGVGPDAEYVVKHIQNNVK